MNLAAGLGGRRLMGPMLVHKLRSVGSWTVSVVVWAASLSVDIAVAANMSTKYVYVCQDGYSNRTGLYFKILVLTVPLAGVAVWRCSYHGKLARSRDGFLRRLILATVCVTSVLMMLGVVWAFAALARRPVNPCFD